MNTANIHSGDKFYRYLDNIEEPEVVRIYSMPSKKSKSDSVMYFDKDGNKKRMSLGYLLDNYKMLRPDGLMIFSIVKVGTGVDVIVALQSIADASKGPYAICRQSIYDHFSNISNNNEDICYVGMSISRDTCPSNVKFDECMICSGLEFSKPIGIYLDDTLDGILKLFSNTRFDKAMLECEKHVLASSKKVFLGLNKTLKGLLESNQFMSDFRRCFKITEVPFHIDEESEILSTENLLFLENELKVNIMETYVVKYTKEIDLRSIKRDYILVSSAQDQFDAVYLVGYDTTDGEYVPRMAI